MAILVMMALQMAYRLSKSAFHHISNQVFDQTICCTQAHSKLKMKKIVQCNKYFYIYYDKKGFPKLHFFPILAYCLKAVRLIATSCTIYYLLIAESHNAWKYVKSGHISIWKVLRFFLEFRLGNLSNLIYSLHFKISKIQSSPNSALFIFEEFKFT